MTQENIREIFSENLNRLLSEKGYQQTDLAEITGVSSGTTSSWCSGTKVPRMDKIQNIANWLGVNMSELLEPYTPDRAITHKKQVIFDRISAATSEQIDQLNDLLDVIWKESEQ